jgi:hypothetical protein
MIADFRSRAMARYLDPSTSSSSYRSRASVFAEAATAVSDNRQSTI